MVIHVARIHLTPPGLTGEMLLRDSVTGYELRFEANAIPTAPGWVVGPPLGKTLPKKFDVFPKEATRIMSTLTHADPDEPGLTSSRGPYLMTVVGRLLVEDDIATLGFSTGDLRKGPVLVNVRRTDNASGYALADVVTGCEFVEQDDELTREVHRVARLIIHLAGPYVSSFRRSMAMGNNTAKTLGLQQPSPVALVSFTATADTLHLVGSFGYSDPNIGAWDTRRQININETFDRTGWRAFTATNQTHFPNPEPFVDDALQLVRDQFGEGPRGF